MRTLSHRIILKPIGKLLGCALAVALASVSTYGQATEDTPAAPLKPDPANLRAYIELARSDIRTQKTLIIAQNASSGALR